MYDEIYKTPNYGYPKGSQGRNGQKIIAIGLHISGADWSSNFNWIMNPIANASYNAIIKDDGKIVSLVPEENAAYAHGKVVNSIWPLLKPGKNPNLYTLSVARTGSDQRTWTAAQLNSTLKLLTHWCSKYQIKPARPYIFGHFEIDTRGRWYCPGKNFFETVITELENGRLRSEVRAPAIYKVVAGSFRYRENADHRVALLAKLGIKALILKTHDKNGQDIYRVVTGSYLSADNARLNASMLQDMGLDSFVAAEREG